MKLYNNSDVYAIFVGHVADMIGDNAPAKFVGPWQPVERFTRDRMQRFQEVLVAQGYDVGKVDGLAGFKTRQAIGLTEKKLGLPLTCYPSSAVIDARVERSERRRAIEGIGALLPRFCPARLAKFRAMRIVRALNTLTLLALLAAVCLPLASRDAPPRRKASPNGSRASGRRRKAAGITRATYDRAFAGLTPDPEVIEQANYQPEYVKPIGEYIDRVVSDKRIETGKQKLEENKALLDAIEKRYGVDRHIIIAIWGVEFELRHAARRQERDPLARDARLFRDQSEVRPPAARSRR